MARCTIEETRRKNRERMRKWHAENPRTPEQKKEKNAYLRAWHAANPEKSRTYQRKHRAKTKEKWRKYHRDYRAANRDKFRAQKRARYALNREKVLVYERARRAANADAMRLYQREYARKHAWKFTKRQDDCRRVFWPSCKASCMRIGVTIFVRKDRAEFPVWVNGANQNCIFLARTLRLAGHDVRMFFDGDGVAPITESLPAELQDIPWCKISNASVKDLDLLIQAGAQISAEHEQIVRARGGRVVFFKFGSDMPIDAERTIHNLSSGAIFNGCRPDEIWTTTQHAATCGSYWEILYRCPVRVLPHIWLPSFVDQIVAALPPGLSGRYTAERAKRPKKRIAILEPNINLVKTCHVPIVICEEAFRRAPELIENVFVCNAVHLRSHLTFSSMIGALDMQAAKSSDGLPVISCEPRFNTPWFMAQNAEVCVSHQWIPSANYTMYDLLYLGYPLVHNCTDLHDGTFWYDGFDAKEGAGELLECLIDQFDPEFVEAAQRDGRAFVDTRRADNPKNVRAHALAIEDLFR